MKKELSDRSVLVMYDIRNIQNYIFNTNKVKDIIGASQLVDNLLKKGIIECSNMHKEITLRIIFIGGGNACIAYDTGAEARIMNRALALWIQQNTYSLQLATAVVEKTERYDSDYEKLQKKMAEVKMKMTKTSLIGALPIVKREDSTGLPVSFVLKERGNEYVSGEVYLKRKNIDADSRGQKFDDIVDKKGEDSTLAVVHIDGNNMGQRIMTLMKNETDYDNAIERMRMISENINNSFESAFTQMNHKAKEWSKRMEGDCEDKTYIRKIIRAGDDITFVCTGKLAISLVETFVEALGDKVLLCSNDGTKNIDEYGFSVCVGIAYMHSHFPFSEAYRIAEMCCENAKEKAKQESSKVGGIIGNWIDFQICKDVQSVYLKENREKNYRLPGGEYLLKRPYYIPYKNVVTSKLKEMNEKNGDNSIEILKQQIEYLRKGRKQGGSGMMNSDIKNIRNTYSMGTQVVDTLISFLESRDKILNLEAFNQNNVANWYDAVEIYELYTDMNKAEDDEKREKDYEV